MCLSHVTDWYLEAIRASAGKQFPKHRILKVHVPSYSYIVFMTKASEKTVSNYYALIFSADGRVISSSAWSPTTEKVSFCPNKPMRLVSKPFASRYSRNCNRPISYWSTIKWVHTSRSSLAMPSGVNGLTKTNVTIALTRARPITPRSDVRDHNTSVNRHLPLPIQNGPVFPLGVSDPPKAKIHQNGQ